METRSHCYRQTLILAEIKQMDRDAEHALGRSFDLANHNARRSAAICCGGKHRRWIADFGIL